VLRVVSYLEGALLEDALPASPELLGALGGFLGRVDAHSLEFELEDGEQELVNERAENPWNIDSCAQSVRGLREYLATQAQGELVNHFLQVYEQRFLASHRAARKALLHNDFNEQNVLVDSATRTRVVGLIDFGDMALTAVINSPAIALTYLLLRSRDLAGDGVAFLRAYRAALPLRGEELVLLQPLIAMRLCVSLCMAARQSKLDPGNAHTQIANDDKWALLRKLREFSPERAAAAWTPP
jgi:Ser/Thr protein kinase RdoA (MazF antagonist)